MTFLGCWELGRIYLGILQVHAASLICTMRSNYNKKTNKFSARFTTFEPQIAIKIRKNAFSNSYFAKNCIFLKEIFEFTV